MATKAQVQKEIKLWERIMKFQLENYDCSELEVENKIKELKDYAKDLE